MSLKLPNDKIVYNLPEQVGVNAENIKYLATVYKEIDSIPAQYADLKEDYDTNIKAYFDDTMKPTFTGWTTTFNGWTNTLDTYLANMSSAAVGAIAGQDIAPKTVSQTNANYAVSMNFVAGGTFTITNIYNRFEVINNILYIVVSFKLTATMSGTPTELGYTSPNLTTAIAEKVYDVDGDTVHDTKTAACLITVLPLIVSKGKAYNSARVAGYLYFANNVSENTTNLYAVAETGISVSPGDELYVSARGALTLI